MLFLALLYLCCILTLQPVTCQTLNRNFSLGANLSVVQLATDVPRIDPAIFNQTTYSGVLPNDTARTLRIQGQLLKRQPSRPSAVDWRDRNGLSWLCSIQNQGGCQSCSFFATAALVETQIKIDHGYWAKRSEGDIRDGFLSSALRRPSLGPTQFCDQSGGDDGPLGWVSLFGATDPDCFAYHATNPDPYIPCVERSTRSCGAFTYTNLGDMEDQKHWLNSIGPLACYLEFVDTNIRQTFYDYTSGVYKAPAPDPSLGYGGAHSPLIVGYNDDGGYWIVRNQWTSSWGMNGYAYIGYGQLNIDSFVKHGYSGTGVDPVVTRRHHNGNMLHKSDTQTSNGPLQKDFAFVACGRSALIFHIRGGGEDGLFPWSDLGNVLSFARQGQCNGQPAFIDVTSLFTGEPSAMGGAYEVLYWNVLAARIDHIRLEPGGWRFQGSFDAFAAAGYPGLIQSNYGHPGNLEAVVRNLDGSLNHFWRPQNTSGRWTFGNQISPPGTILMSGSSLVQSNVGRQGNFYVIATMTDGTMRLFWRDNDGDIANLHWFKGESFAGDVGSTPAIMIQTTNPTVDELSVGDFEVLVAVRGQALRYRRDNSDIASGGVPSDVKGGQWSFLDSFGTGNIRHVWSFMQGPFYQNLEAVVENLDGSLHLWFFDRQQQIWKGPFDGPPGIV